LVLIGRKANNRCKETCRLVYPIMKLVKFSPIYFYYVRMKWGENIKDLRTKERKYTRV
jgi:hypothetical protein